MDKGKSFKIIGYAEGVSFLALLGIAMPLKYLADQPHAVKLVGWIHGVLFILYLFAAFRLSREQKWTFAQLRGAFLAALLPFGPFVFEHRLKHGMKR